MTNNTNRVSIELTYADGDAYASVHTANYAAGLRNDLAMAPNVTGTVKVEPYVTVRPVAFTHSEADRIMEFMRKFEASSEAVDLLHMIGLRKTYAMAEDFDALDADDEPVDVSEKFDNVKSQPVFDASRVPQTVNASVQWALDLSDDEKAVLRFIWSLQKHTFDGYVKVRPNMYVTAGVLESRGLLGRKDTKVFNHIYFIPETARFVIKALEDGE